jgi:tripartite ATP-independent transporter DctM subunit
MLGRTVLPAMVKRGYDIELSAAMIQGGASLAPIIPPSLLAVIIGSMAGVSISSLLIAGIAPGLLLALMSIGYAYWALWRNPRLAPSDDAPDAAPRISLTRAFLQMLPFSIIIFSVLGVILLGVATPSEAAATGVLGSLATAAIYRRLSWRMVKDSVASTMRISTMILIIVATSVLFGQLLAFTGATARTVEWFTMLDLPPLVMFWLMMTVPFVLCMFIDQMAFMLVAIPIYTPLVESLNFDPIWFWTMFSINMTLASLTPPFGYTMFALRAAAPEIITLKQVFDSSWPITWVFVLGMVIMTAVPQIVTFLPALLK